MSDEPFNYFFKTLNRGGLLDLIYPPPRAYGKSIIMQLAKTRATNPMTSTVVGDPGHITMLDLECSLDFLVRDPFGLTGKNYDRPFLYHGDLIAKFEDRDHPECTVCASLVRMDKRDPRNPNPAAGTFREFYVTHKDKQERVKNKTMALMKAEILHKRLVAEKLARIAEEQRLIRVERDRQAEEVRINEQHLMSLPAYGGF